MALVTIQLGGDFYQKYPTISEIAISGEPVRVYMTNLSMLLMPPVLPISVGVRLGGVMAYANQTTL